VRIDAVSGQITGVVHVGGAPAAVATGNGLAWVADRKAATVWVIDQRTNQVQSKITVPWSIPAGPGGPAIAFRGRSAWVLDGAGKSVSRIDGDTKEGTSIKLSAVPSSVAVGPETALVVERTAGTVDLVGVLGNSARPLQVGGAPTGVALAPDGSTGWVVDHGRKEVVQVDTRRVKVLRHIRLPVIPDQVTLSSDGALWVTSSRSNQVIRIDPGVPVARLKLIPVGNGPTGIAFGMGRVWVADSNDTTLSSVDPNPDHGYRVATRQLGLHPAAVAVDDQTGNVWVTVSA
jgi:DNA-binding beta-propeller fold protein YncE